MTEFVVALAGYNFAAKKTLFLKPSINSSFLVSSVRYIVINGSNEELKDSASDITFL